MKIDSVFLLIPRDGSPPKLGTKSMAGSVMLCRGRGGTGLYARAYSAFGDSPPLSRCLLPLHSSAFRHCGLDDPERANVEYEKMEFGLGAADGVPQLTPRTQTMNRAGTG